MGFAPENHPEIQGNDIALHSLALLTSAWLKLGQVLANDKEEKHG